MRRFYFDKLVRDKILGRCLDDPKVLHTEYKKLSDLDLKRELVRKIAEEGLEVPARGVVDDEIIEELADVQTVLDSLREQYGVSSEDIDAAINRKADKNGRFGEGVYIEYVDLADDSEWIGKLREQPDKYREE